MRGPGWTRGGLQAAWLAAALLLVSAAAAKGAATRPGPPACSPDCTKHGNCGEGGVCSCPYGRIGDACEINLLQPCQQFPDTWPYCSSGMLKSCECLLRCQLYYNRTDSAGRTAFRAPQIGFLPERACYERSGVPPDEQYSRVPAEDEKGVTYRTFNGSRTLTWQEAVNQEGTIDVESRPLSDCPKQCSRRGYCGKGWKDPNSKPVCLCHRGFVGEACETQVNRCPLQCNGRGKCLDLFCHCDPPFFSIGCSRSKTYPSNHSRPSPVDFKIYMYELSTRDAYDVAHHAGWQMHDPIYLAHEHFIAQFVNSPVRTEDPSEANLFFIPALLYGYSGNMGTGYEHLGLLLDKVQTEWPYWNRTGGRDHFLWVTRDGGMCAMPEGPMWDAIKIVHFGMHTTESNNYAPLGHSGHPEYGCHHPLRDVVAAPHDEGKGGWLKRTLAMSADQIVAKKKKLLFFAGAIWPDDLTYAGGARAALFKLTQEWKDPDFDFNSEGVGDYEGAHREARFCYAVYGFGFGMRLSQAVLAGCIPVIVAEHVFQPYEEVVPYELFSVRLTLADLPRLREILRSIDDDTYNGMVEALLQYAAAFTWEPGGAAFDYTVRALRRKHMNMKALYF